MIKKKFKICDMHCISCAMNIDFDLEDFDGVKSASTSYAKAQCEVEFEEEKIDSNKNYEVSLVAQGEILGGPNGLMINPKNQNLMVAALKSGRILEIDYEGGVHVVKRGLEGLDGIDYDRSGNIYVSSHSKGEIYKISRYGRGPIVTLETGLITPADISYDRKKDEILIPSFDGNTVTTLSPKKK